MSEVNCIVFTKFEYFYRQSIQIFVSMISLPSMSIFINVAGISSESIAFTLTLTPSAESLEFRPAFVEKISVSSLFHAPILKQLTFSIASVFFNSFL